MSPSPIVGRDGGPPRRPPGGGPPSAGGMQPLAICCSVKYPRTSLSNSEPTAFVWSKEHPVDLARRVVRIELRASDSVLVSAVTWWSGAKPASTKVP